MPTINIHEPIKTLARKLNTVGTETVTWDRSCGRISALELCSERDSPARNVSAMDGYALRVDDLGRGELPVVGTIAAGTAPMDFPSGTCVRLFTGAVVPDSADAVVRREDVIELGHGIRIRSDVQLQRSDNIRKQGENAKRGQVILPAGKEIHTARLSAVLASGLERIRVYRKVRVAIINTGDELIEQGKAISDWQIRDSNGPTLQHLFRHAQWIEVTSRIRIGDNFEAVVAAIQQALDSADAVLLTGGVSMGETDHVPQAVEACGAEVVFHRIPIRPGKPLLGAVSTDGKLILGLPGNPVSVAVTGLRFALPLLKRAGGIEDYLPTPLSVRLNEPSNKLLPLVWFRLARYPTGDDASHAVELVDSKGSGDLISLARSDGFVEIPADSSGDGPFEWYPWP